MADRIFTSGAEAAHFSPVSKSKPSPYIGWEYQEVRFSSVRELDEFGKCGWEFFHIEAQAGGYRKALGKRLCST